MTPPAARTVVAVAAALLAVGAAASQQPDDPEFGGRRGSEWVRILKEDAAPRKRRAAVVALGQLWADGQYSPSLPNVGRALQHDSSAAVRLQAAAVLGQLTADDLLRRESAKGTIETLASALVLEKDSAVRRETATALGRFGELSKSAVLPLTAAAKDAEAATRAAALDALGRIGPDARAAAPELVPLLKDSDKAVQRAAAFALGRIAPEDSEAIGTALAARLAGENDGDLRRELLTSLGLIGDRSEETALVLASALKFDDAEARRSAARSLARFGEAVGPAVPALLACLRTDADKNVRIDALRALGSGLGAGLAQHLAALTDRMNVDAEASRKGDADFEVRAAIADELGALGPAGRPAVPALRRSLRDPQVKVREAAAAAIRKIEKPPEKKP